MLSRANDLLLSVDCGLFATCTFVRFDPVAWEISSARAGHVPAIWATTDGRSGLTADPGGLPLGILPGETYPVAHRRLRTAGAFVLLTDGVVEGPSFPIEAGLNQVARLVSANAGGEPETVAAAAMSVAEFTGHTDDAAVIVLRFDGDDGRRRVKRGPGARVADDARPPALSDD